jgi:hypothetical protein
MEEHLRMVMSMVPAVVVDSEVVEVGLLLEVITHLEAEVGEASHLMRIEVVEVVAVVVVVLGAADGESMLPLLRQPKVINLNHSSALHVMLPFGYYGHDVQVQCRNPA